MPIEGHSVYEPEVMEMMKRLEAKSIVMVVIDGNKNKRNIEYASAIKGVNDIFRIIQALEAVAASMKIDLTHILSDLSFRRSPID